MAEDHVYSVLFLSQRGAARSVMAAALLNVIGTGKFRAFSAGVRPAAEFDRVALELLDHAKVPLPAGAPQHYQEFAGASASDLDFVFTLSDTAAGEPLPVWPGQPATAHWRCTDAEKFGNDAAGKRLALIDTRAQLERRLRVFVNLPFASLDRLSLQKHVEEIGEAASPARDPAGGG
jgi:arsenate reductase (thioredoxin)